METLIQTTFAILLFFALINLATSAGLYILQKKSTFAWMSVFWVAVIVNFVIQGMVQEGQCQIIMAYGFAVIPLNILGYVSLKFLNLKYPVKSMLVMSILALGITPLLDSLHLSFTQQAMPLAVATAAPLFFTAYVFLIRHRKISTAVMKIESVVLIAQGIHCINFALFREDPSAQLWGWTVSYALYQLLACVLPAMTLEDFHRDETVRLEKLVELRTNELEKALEQKNMMVRVLTHDISNCLVPLTFFNKLLTKKSLSEMKQEDLSLATTRIGVSAERISSMVVQVRNYEAMISKKDKNHLKFVSLKDCLNETILQLSELLKSKKINLKIDFTGGLSDQVKVQVDSPSFTNSVLSNLLTNSVKFSHVNGEILIQVKAYPDSKVEILFIDHGTGMPQEMLEKVFSFSHNTSRDGTSGEKGTGFGLPILKKYIEIYEGEISVSSREQSQSTPGETCFAMILKAEL